MTLMAALHYFVSSALSLEILHWLTLITIHLYLPPLLKRNPLSQQTHLTGSSIALSHCLLCVYQSVYYTPKV